MGGGFEALSGGKPIIQHSEFSMALDVFAEMEATDCDIEFEFEEDVEEVAQRQRAPTNDAVTSPLAVLPTKGPQDEFPRMPKQRTLVITNRRYITRLQMKTLANETDIEDLERTFRSHVSQRVTSGSPDLSPMSTIGEEDNCDDLGMIRNHQTTRLTTFQVDQMLSTAGARKYAIGNNKVNIRDKSVLAMTDCLAPFVEQKLSVVADLRRATCGDDDITKMIGMMDQI